LQAANAGGVAVSGLEMAQNAQLTKWSREEVDGKLKSIMRNIFISASEAAEEYQGDKMNLKHGANIACFLKVANAMKDQGSV
jgi:glutamate dehydrogenase (NADP+)